MVLDDGGKRGLVWWNNLNSIRGGAGLGVGRWFDDNRRHEVGSMA